MTRHAPLVKEIASRLKELDISSLVYFHTDHFEPWRVVGDTPAVGQEVVDAIGEFCRVTGRIDYARRLTLFYKPHLNYAMRREEGLTRADPRDLVGFLPRAEHEERFGRQAMQEVVNTTSHDIQLHIHHEYYTATTAHTDPVLVDWFSSPLGRSFDAQRLELAIRLNREIIARETGRSTSRWFFIHGHWALNASDDSSCTITNEIDILLRNGCLGDFTFPAARAHTNPRIKVPYLCRPVDKVKGYDLPEAEPEIAYGNRSAATKFFIWASQGASNHYSLDYSSPSAKKQIDNTGKAVRDLIDGAYIAGGQLFIKTHAHSMHPSFFEHVRYPVYPHQNPATQTMLTVLFDAAAQAGLSVRFLTVPEVYDAITTAKHKPEIDLTRTYLEPTRLFRPDTRQAVRKGRKESQAGRAEVAEIGGPFGMAQALELVRETTATILAQRIEKYGVRGSGAYNHYKEMLDRGFPIAPRELFVFDFVSREMPDLKSYHEIGSGIGTLPFLLALNGFPAVGIECDKRRHDTAVAVWQVLRRKVARGTSCRLVHARFPAGAFRYDSANALAIITDFITTQTAEQRSEILAGLRAYPYVLMDLKRFCTQRDDAAAQRELLDELATHGLKAAGDVSASADSAFILLRNDAIVQRRRFAFWQWPKEKIGRAS